MSANTIKNERFEMRISAGDKRLISEAAKIRGMSPAEFTLKAAIAASRKTLSRVQTIRVSQRDQIAMADALLDPPAPNARLRKAMARYRKMVAKD